MEKSLQQRALENAFANRVDKLFERFCEAIEVETHDAQRAARANSFQQFARSYAFAVMAYNEATSAFKA